MAALKRPVVTVKTVSIRVECKPQHDPNNRDLLRRWVTYLAFYKKQMDAHIALQRAKLTQRMRDGLATFADILLSA